MLAPSVIVDIEMLVLVERVTHLTSLAAYWLLTPMLLFMPNRTHSCFLYFYIERKTKRRHGKRSGTEIRREHKRKKDTKKGKKTRN